MRKLALLFVVAVLSFGFVGCASSGWIGDLKKEREATVCGKEIVQVPASDNSGATQPEYRVQITWHDVERDTHPALWSVVDEKTYQGISLNDEVWLVPSDIGQMKGHVTVIYYWMDERTYEINELKYEFDLPYDPAG